ncbi:substrate-binding domain-containing protein [Sphaerisporangium sp. NPDC005288]|uniref:substrate-binding domain-containing protein n=1 Tax=Sphaerisporangium sp. NPDC005288 TaxID=3155114 RepID=UPI0033BADB8C
MTGRHRNPDPLDGDAWSQEAPSWRDRFAGLLEAARTSGPLATVRRRAVVALSLGVVLLASLVGGAYALVSRSACAEHPQLRVMAAPEMGPALQQVAERYAKDGGCASVTVLTGSPADVADKLALRKDLLDVWVPDDSVWVDLAKVQGADRELFSPGTSIARSPVIMGVTERTAVKLVAGGEQAKKGSGHDRPADGKKAASGGSDGADADDPGDRDEAGDAVGVSEADAEAGLAVGELAHVRASWMLLVPMSSTKKRLPKASTTLPAPSRFASGLVALDALNTAVADRPAALKIVQGMTTNLKRSVLPSREALFDLVERPAKGTDPIIVDSEQAIWRHNGARTDGLVVGLYPEEGTLALDYPYVPMTKDAVKMRAAEEFRGVVLSGTGRALLQASGFRDPSGRAGAAMDERHGVRVEPPEEITAPVAMTRLRSLLSMRLLLADTRNLLLLDVSRSMGKQIPGMGATRVRALADVAAAGVRALPQGGDIGLWIFATGLDGDKDYKELVPVGPLQQRGPEVERALRELPDHIKGDTGLYDAVLAAFRSASARQVKNMLSSVIVFTDGRDDDRHGIKLNELLATLQKEFDPGRPVTITLIGYGEDADAAELKQIARVTNGAAMVAKSFDQAQQIFLQALANRVCLDRERCDSQEG